GRQTPERSDRESSANQYLLSSSTGGAARNSGPPKFDRERPDSSIASSAASSASARVRAVAPCSLSGRKSTRPAMVVARWSTGKRLIERIPERPPVSAAQLSRLPCPSEVTTPIPVTATSGRPNLSV